MTFKHDPVLRPQSLRAQQEQPKSFAHKSALALSISALMFSTVTLADDRKDDDAINLDTLQIEDRTIDTNPYAEAGAPYKARISGDERHVRPLAETPQTINVLTKTQIKDSGRTDLKQILQTQPGITVGTGENGNAFGDRYVIRGHEARSDVFVDGLRDPGMTVRESFATEQVEVTKGPSSTFAGRGSTGGAVNSVTKQASTDYNFTEITAGVGTDEYYRATVDSNQVLTDNIALRANVLYGAEEVPDRAPADRERKGAALSASFEPTNQLKVVADYYYLDASDAPDLGTYIMPNGGRPVKNIPVYVQKQDFLKSEINTGTLRVSYEFNDNFRVQNATRYGTTDNGYMMTGARGTDRAPTDPDAPGAYTISLSTHQGWQEVEYFANHLNFFLDTKDPFGLEHQLVFGIEYSDHKVLNGVYSNVNTGATNCMVAGRGPAAGGYCILGPDGRPVGNLGTLMGRHTSKGLYDSDWNVETISYALMDTVDLSKDWTVFAGIRYDDFDYKNRIASGNPRTETDYKYSDGLWNGHIGVVYNVTDYGNVYFNWSTSAEINGGESDVGGSCGYGGLCGDPTQVTDSEPEKVRNLELGTKWNLMNEKLLATAAVFQTTKKGVMESIGGNDYANIGTLNTGKNRVKGIELSLAGNITDDLSAVGGVAVMRSEVLDSFVPANVGLKLANFAEESAFLQLRYQVIDNLAVGAVANYRSEVYAGQPDTGAGYDAARGIYSYTVPSYTTYDMFASYDATDKLNLRLNVLNVTDKDYYLAAYRSGAFTYIGDRMRTMLTMTYQF